MSLKFDLVINCDLREDTPAEHIEAIRCLTTKDYELPTKPQLPISFYGEPEWNMWNSFSDYHFLASDPEQLIVSNFRRIHRLTIPLENNREVHRYSLQYCGRELHDDYFYSHHIPFIHWLASITCENYIGYYVETTNKPEYNHPEHFVVTNGKLQTIKISRGEAR